MTFDTASTGNRGFTRRFYPFRDPPHRFKGLGPAQTSCKFPQIPKMVTSCQRQMTSALGSALLPGMVAWSLLLGGLMPSEAHAQTSEPSDVEVAAQLDKLSSDNKISFLLQEQGVSRGIPREAGVVFDLRAYFPLMEAALTHALTGNPRARVLADLTSSAKPVVLKPEGAAEQAGLEGAQLKILTSDNTLIQKDVQRRWPKPDFFVDLSLFSDPHPQTAASLGGSMLEDPAHSVCVSLELVRGSSGVISTSELTCFDRDSWETDLADWMARTIGRTCRARPFVVLLPIKYHKSGRASLEKVNSPLSLRTLKIITGSGCRLQDMPSQTLAGSKGQEARLPVAGLIGASGWRYHPRLSGISIPAQLKGWKDGDVAIIIRHAWGQESTKSLIKRLEANQETGLIDPDLRSSVGTTTRVQRFQLEAVHVGTGELLTLGTLEAGADTPQDILATALVDMVFADAPRSWLEVHRIPPNSHLRLDRVSRPPSPGPELVQVAAGRHRLELMMGRTSEVATRARVKAGTYGVVALAVPFGWLKVASAPEGAQLTVDETPWGAAPAKRSLPAGRHVVTATIEECGSARAEATVRIGEETAILVNLPGFVEATAIPEDASIFLDGERIGTGHVRVSASHGEHEVSFELEDFETHSSTITVGGCQPTEVSHTFFGKLEVASMPERAEVRVDDEVLGPAPSSSFLLEGAHQVACLWCEYGAAAQTVSLQAGRITPITMTLTPPKVSVEVGPVVKLGLGMEESGLDLKLGGWYRSQFGLLTQVGFRDSGNEKKLEISAFASYKPRLLGAKWSSMIGVGIDYLRIQPEALVGPAARVAIRRCLSQGISAELGMMAALPAVDGTPRVSLLAGLHWQSAMKW